MAIESPISDTSRIQHSERDQSWPEVVKIQLQWKDGSTRTEIISSAQFFGRGEYGAPLSGEFIIQSIERMRRQGPPEAKPVVNKGKKR